MNQQSNVRGDLLQGARSVKTIREAKIGTTFVRLLADKDGYAGIVIRDGSIKDRVQGVGKDDVWRQLHVLAARHSPNYFGFDGARARFLRIFREGFKSRAYLDHERNYKLKAKEKLQSAAPLAQALTASGLGEPILAAYRATNLLSPFEKTRMQEALRGPHSDQFIRGAAAFAIGELKLGLSEMAQALRPYDVAKWTAVTYLPFLWNSDVHMFLKPEVTKNFAERVGHSFSVDYSPQLDLSVYLSLLDLASAADRETASLEPTDRIDTQSFVWVVGEYDVDAEAGLD